MRRGLTNQVASSIPVDDSNLPYTAGTVQVALEETSTTADNALNLPIFPILLQHNGTVSDGYFIGYDSLIPGDDTPVVIPKKSQFTNFTFSNSRSNADYTLIFRKNSTGASAFLSVSKVNTQFFTHQLISPESFVAGDVIYIEYQDDGTNASDVGMTLNFKAVT